MSVLNRVQAQSHNSSTQLTKKFKLQFVDFGLWVTLTYLTPADTTMTKMKLI